MGNDVLYNGAATAGTHIGLTREDGLTAKDSTS